MAGQIPDPRILNSWEDAFQHPLPVVRKLEQQLRKNIDDNRQKLRSLVGASYRDLLGTAERIIEMDQQMETVETYLGDIGKKCNARTVEKIAENHAQMRKTRDARDENKYRAIAETKILQSALTMVLRIIKAGGDALQASKLLVLSRLLYKSISEGSYAPTVLEELRRKLAALRKKLLAYIERTMMRPSTDKTQHANTLCAYALVTSSTPKEVLRHFLQVRYEQLDGRSDSPSEADMLQMLDLYSQTLVDTRDLFPRRFADSLSQLAKVPLLRDGQVKSVFELNLDIYGTWIAEDVRTFTPWVRHDQLTTGEVTDALASWTNQAHECLLHGLRDYLRGQDDASAIVQVRQKVLSKYMSLSTKLRNNVQVSATHDLREAFLERLKELATKAANITDSFLEESDISSLVEQDSAPRSLWDLGTMDLDLSQGALKFRGAIVHNRYSRSKSIQAEAEKLDKWQRRVYDMSALADEMRVNKWDNDPDFDFEDLDEGESFLRALTKDDPEKLQRKLGEATKDAIGQLVTTVSSGAAATQHAALYLRIWREVDQRRRALETRLSVATDRVSPVVLYRHLANSVSKDPTNVYVQSAKTETRAATTLWDGSPLLPAQPSPAVFRLLRTLHQAMSEEGNDLWSPQAVFEIKGVILDVLSIQLSDHRFNHSLDESTLTNGYAEANEAENNAVTNVNGIHEPKDSRRDWLLQNLFDIHYLRRILHRPGDDKPGNGVLEGIVHTMRQQLELDEASNERLQKSANDYWKRTYLLFGLLATGGGGKVGG